MRTSFSIIALASILATTLAMPAYHLSERQTTVCSTGSPLCCDTDVLGVADLDCSTPPTTPTTTANFTTICADIGKIDMCCILPILEQGLLCTKPA